MQDLSRLANIAEIIGAIIVVGGLFFALLQMQQLRQQRRELAAIELFRFFGNPSFAEAYNTVLHMQDDMSAEEIRNGDGELEQAAMVISTTMENIGVMTFQRIVPFAIVNNLMGNSAIVLWSKLENWTMALRVELDEPSAFEWFQWLVERLQQYPTDNSLPAYESHKTWEPSNTTKQL